MFTQAHSPILGEKRRGQEAPCHWKGCQTVSRVRRRRLKRGKKRAGRAVTALSWEQEELARDRSSLCFVYQAEASFPFRVLVE